MSLKFTLLHAIGVVAGILIPGASVTVANAVHEVQQHFAEIYGAAATKLAEQLKLDTTGMSGPDKVFYIAKALIETAKSQGFKGDLKVLEAAMLDLAQTAFRNRLPTIEADAVALLASLHLGPVLSAVTELMLPTIEQKVEGAVAGVLGVDQTAVAQAA